MKWNQKKKRSSVNCYHAALCRRWAAYRPHATALLILPPTNSIFFGIPLCVPTGITREHAPLTPLILFRHFSPDTRSIPNFTGIVVCTQRPGIHITQATLYKELISTYPYDMYYIVSIHEIIIISRIPYINISLITPFSIVRFVAPKHLFFLSWM